MIEHDFKEGPRPVYEVDGLTDRFYLVIKYTNFWFEQRLTFILQNRSQRSIKLVFMLCNSLLLIGWLSLAIVRLERDDHNDILPGIGLRGRGSAQNQEAIGQMILMTILGICLYGFWIILKEKRTQVVNYLILCGITITFDFVLVLAVICGAVELFLGLKMYPVEDMPHMTNTTVPYFWEKIQWENRCCGYFGPGDWINYMPKSCCPKNDEKKHKLDVNTLSKYQEAIFKNQGDCSMVNAYEHGCKFVFRKRIIWPAIYLGCIAAEALSFLAAYLYLFAIKLTRGYVNRRIIPLQP